MFWNKDTYKEVRTKHQELYDLLDKKHLKIFKELKTVILEGCHFYDYSEGGIQDSILYLRVRGMIVQHPTVAYLYRLR